MIWKARWVSLALAALGAGCLFLAANDHELEPDQVAVRSEGLTDGALRWSFDADNSEGRPLETVFYTLECTPRHEENAVEVVVRLYETPAHGRDQLHRTTGSHAAFDLVYNLPAPGLAPQSGLAYRISFCGRDLGTWKADKAMSLVSRHESPLHWKSQFVGIYN